MKRWRCDDCARRGVPREWENYLTTSFCEVCATQGTRLIEYGCFACREEGVVFYAPFAASHPCPDCGSDAYRIVHAPAVIGQARREDHAAADQALITELENQKVSTTSLKREPKVRPQTGHPFAARWAPANELIPQGGHGVGGHLPFGMPRPQVNVVGRDNRPAEG